MAAAAPRAYGPFEGCGRGQPPLSERGAGPSAVGCRRNSSEFLRLVTCISTDHGCRAHTSVHNRPLPTCRLKAPSSGDRELFQRAPVSSDMNGSLCLLLSFSKALPYSLAPRDAPGSSRVFPAPGSGSARFRGALVPFSGVEGGWWELRSGGLV